MSSAQECVEEFNQEIITFEWVAYFSLGLTAVSSIATLFYKQTLEGNLAFAWKLYFGLSAVKLLLGLLLFTAFSPGCPSGCDTYCGRYHPSVVYPLIVITVGLLWAARGKRYYDRDVNGDSQGAHQETEMNASNGNEVL